MTTLENLHRLEAQVAARRAPRTGFRLEGGGMFYPDLDPLSYLLRYGTETPRGRITGCTDTGEGYDPISRSFLETIHALIG